MYIRVVLVYDYVFVILTYIFRVSINSFNHPVACPAEISLVDSTDQSKSPVQAHDNRWWILPLRLTLVVSSLILTGCDGRSNGGFISTVEEDLRDGLTV